MEDGCGAASIRNPKSPSSLQSKIENQKSKIRLRFHLLQPLPIGLGGDYPGSDFAAPALDDVGVADRDGDGGHMGLDDRLVLQTAVFIRAVGGAHDVH